MSAKLDKLDADMQKAESRVAKSAKKMRKEFDKGGGMMGSVTEGLAKAFALMGALEGGAKAMSAGMALFSGETDKAMEILKTLPFGIGPAIGAIEQLVDGITGATAAAEKLAATQKAAGLAEAARVDSAKREATALNALANERLKIQRALSLTGAIGEARASLEKSFGRDDQVKALRLMASGSGSTKVQEELKGALFDLVRLTEEQAAAEERARAKEESERIAPAPVMVQQVKEVVKTVERVKMPTMGSAINLTQTAFSRMKAAGGDIPKQQLVVQKQIAKGIDKIANNPRLGVAAFN